VVPKSIPTARAIWPAPYVVLVLRYESMRLKFVA